MVSPTLTTIGGVVELKIDFSNKRALASGVVLVCLIGMLLFFPGVLQHFEPQTCTINGVCQHEQQLNLLYDLVPVFVLIGIIIGASVFFFMSTKLDNKKEELEKTTKALIQFLNKDERRVVEKIISEQGKVLQSEITRMEGLGKVKSHRILQRLSDRGVIEIEAHGKTNIVKLTKAIKDAIIK
jgi:uncharacterized membrane protein